MAGSSKDTKLQSARVRPEYSDDYVLLAESPCVPRPAVVASTDAELSVGAVAKHRIALLPYVSLTRSVDDRWSVSHSLTYEVKYLEPHGGDWELVASGDGLDVSAVGIFDDNSVVEVDLDDILAKEVVADGDGRLWVKEHVIGGAVPILANVGTHKRKKNPSD